MTTETDDPTVYETDPEARLYRWKRTPSQIEQALEAARDVTTTREFVNILCSLGFSVQIHGDEKPWFPTTAWVVGVPDGRVSDVITIARRAGWTLEDVTWELERLEFRKRGENSE